MIASTPPARAYRPANVRFVTLRPRIMQGVRRGKLAKDSRPGLARQRLKTKSIELGGTFSRPLVELDEPFVPGATQPHQNGDVLLAVDREGHRGRVDAGIGVKLPQLGERLGVERIDLAGWMAGEHKLGSCQQAPEHRVLGLELGGDLAGGDVDRRDASRDRQLGHRTATDEGLAWLIVAGLGLLDVGLVAALDYRNVPELQVGIIGGSDSASPPARRSAPACSDRTPRAFHFRG